MKGSSYCLFDTPFGTCGIAWAERAEGRQPFAVTCFQLPEASRAAAESRLVQHSGAREPSAPPAQIAGLIERVRRHLQGDPQDFRDVPVDMEGVGGFAQKVYRVTREIPVGKTATYLDLAKTLGQPGAVRTVGRALGRNPIPLIIPCHRVMAAHGRPGGFSAHGGRVTKAKLLALEGAVVNLCLELNIGP